MAEIKSKKEPVPRCKVCGKPIDADSPNYPFCGQRCRRIDLGKWLSGNYRISRPIEQSDLDEG